MLTEFPLSTNIFITAKLITSIVITIGSSWSGSIVLKFSLVNVISDKILLWITLMDWMTLKCLFLNEHVVPPPTNPLVMVIITALKGPGTFWPCSSQWFCSLLPFWLSTLRFFASLQIFQINRQKWSTCTNSYILSFNAKNSSVVWP